MAILKLFRAQLTVLWAHLFGKEPKGLEDATQTLIDGLNRAKSFLTNVGTLTIAAMFPNGIGTLVDNTLVSLINKLLPTLEIGKDCEVAVTAYKANNPNATDQQIADVIIQTIVAEIGKLPSEWQGKHWLDVATRILMSIENITETEAKSMIQLVYAQDKQKA